MISPPVAQNAAADEGPLHQFNQAYVEIGGGPDAELNLGRQVSH